MPLSIRPAAAAVTGIAVTVIACLLTSCSRQPADDPRRPIVENYANLVLATYEDCLATLRALDNAVDALLANPSEATLAAARDRWREARIPYSRSEAFRFYAGPIDREDGPEGQINGWPLDENHIDAVIVDKYGAAPGLNIIGNPASFPTITTEVIAAQNEAGGEKNIASGYHAIEFLLWGQDFNDPPESAGQRTFEDYVANGDANSANARRGAYLKAAMTLLISDVDSVAAQWREPAAGTENYRSQLVTGDVYTGLKRMLTGIITLAEVEMASERMNVPLLSGDQEEEQSCFSDTSTEDLRSNAVGIESVYFGRYESPSGKRIQGPSLAATVRTADPRIADEIEARLTRTNEALQAVRSPLDREIQPDNKDGQARVQAAIDSLHSQTVSFTRVAKALQIFLSPIATDGD
jgi:putative iron-regulated protein